MTCGSRFDRPALGTNIVTRGMCASRKLNWKVGGLCRLVDRTWKNLPRLQVQRHGIGILLTLKGHDKCERLNTRVRTFTCREGRTWAPAETCCCKPLTRNRGE